MDNLSIQHNPGVLAANKLKEDEHPTSKTKHPQEVVQVVLLCGLAMGPVHLEKRETTAQDLKALEPCKDWM